MNEQPQNLEELLLNDSFVRWIRGLANAREEDYWKNWTARNDENKKLAEEAQKVVQAMQFNRADTSDIEVELNRLNATIDSEEIALQEKNRRKTRTRIYRYISAAAVILIIFTAGFFVLDRPFDFSSEQVAEVPVQTKIKERVFKSNEAKSDPSVSGSATGKLTTGYAEKSTLIFDDGSRVVLNANSTLEYPKGNTANGDIMVRLEGEAFFEIAERSPENRRTFSVRTKDGSVKVLGTKFSVGTRDRHTKVALKKGVVEVHKKGTDDAENYRMKPGELAQFSKAAPTIEVAEINTKVYFSWTENELRFDKTTLSEIVSRIERTYGVDVIVGDRALMDKKISGSIQNNDLDVLLKALSKLLQTPITRNRTTITIAT